MNYTFKNTKYQVVLMISIMINNNIIFVEKLETEYLSGCKV